MGDSIGRGSMEQFEKGSISFVIRLWKEQQTNDDRKSEWRGWIQFVKTGKKHYFTDAKAISPIVARYINARTTDIDSVFEPIPEENHT
ncbi:MAG: hypothetical protein KC421_08540 [Anaerolineales bacterium]|nr:hypothetical protein [Anaerolineales bacterium]